MSASKYANETASRSPDLASESRLLEIRREAELKGKVEAGGIRPSGAPFPVATPEAGYYGIPMLKEPQWSWEIPIYFFVGGASGAAAVIGAMAHLFGADHKLVRDARWMAAIGGGVLSPALLISDLGVPSRFLNMLRVFKLQSPMSVGAWIMTAFASTSAATVFAGELNQRFGESLPIKLIENAGEVLSTLFGLGFNNYTGVLIGATAIPVWNRSVGTLPIHFAVSGLGASVSILELLGHDESRALNALGIGSALLESLEGLNIESQKEEVFEPLKHGGSGWITRIGGLLSGPLPLLLRLLGGSSGSDRSRKLRRSAAIAAVAGSLITRYAWIGAGHVSARNHRLPLQLDKLETPSLPGPLSD